MNNRWVHLHEPPLTGMGGKDGENPASHDGLEHEARKDKLSKELESSGLEGPVAQDVVSWPKRKILSSLEESSTVAYMHS